MKAQCNATEPSAWQRFLLARPARDAQVTATDAGGAHERCKKTARFVDPQAELRKCYVAVMRAHARACDRARAAGLFELDRDWPPWPDFEPFEGLRCGAKGKRTGKPCPHTSIYSSGRCKWHGGLSTGPKTPEGLARSAANGRARSP